MSRSRHSRSSREARRFKRAAQARLAEAEFLLEHQFRTGAVYLAGYAVECLLKALILSSEPVVLNQDTMRMFKGSKAHDFVWLRHALIKRKVFVPRMIDDCLTQLDDWSTE